MAGLEYYEFDPDWEAFASKNGFPRPTNEVPPTGPIELLDMDFTAARPYQTQMDAEWAASHPLESVGYRSRLMTVKVHDGAEISVKVSCPDSSRLQTCARSALPVLFVTHGGGWVSGSHLSEESWLLWPLLKDFDLLIISVEYRLAPENKFPLWIEDSWDVLERFFSDSASFVTGLNAKCDLQKVILAGSSAGATISAVLSQGCRDKGIPIHGVILNVPVLCDYRHFPSKTGISDSYTQCTQTFMGSREMATLWNMVIPSTTAGASPEASPLLGNTKGLPRHLIFVAGRDSLRDEGMAYVRKLEKDGVSVKLEVYKGVPHNFAHYGELKATSKFLENLKTGLDGMLFT